MDGLVEGLLGGLLSLFGVDVKNFKPWLRALFLVLTSWVIGLPILLILGMVEASIVFTQNFWWTSIGLYFFLYLIETFFDWGRKLNEANKNEN